MATAMGKGAVLKVAALISVFALIFGPVLVYEYEADNVKYSVYLVEFGSNSMDVWGEIKVTIHNKNDFDITAQNIRAKIYNPHTSVLVYDYFHAGGTIDAGEKLTEYIEFNAFIDDIPEDELKVVLSAYVKWGSNQGSVIENTFYIPIEY